MKVTHAQAPSIDREIYVMPSFVKAEVRDLSASARWYEAAGFVVLAVMPGPGGQPALVHLRRQRYQDILLVPAGERPAEAFRVTMAAGGDDLVRRAQSVKQHGTGEASGPYPTPWRTNDLTLTDVDGNVVTFTEPRMHEKADEQWTALVRGSIDRPV
jgi:hypothetical protein